MATVQVKVIEHMGDKCIEKLRNFDATAARHSLVVPEGCESIATVAQLLDAARANDNLGEALGIKAKVRTSPRSTLLRAARPLAQGAQGPDILCRRSGERCWRT